MSQSKYSSDVKYASISASGIGDNEIIAAKAGFKFRVLSILLIASGTVNARFESGAGGSALTGQMPVTTNSGFTANYNSDGWFETVVGESLNLELSASVLVSGCMSYVEILAGQSSK